MKVFVFTLGCKVNSYESSCLEELFRARGYETAKRAEDADIFLVNSCTVTSEGDAKARRALLRARRANPEMITVLTGCFPQASPERAAGMENVDVLLGSKNRANTVDAVERFIKTGKKVTDISAHEPDEPFEDLSVSSFGEHTRAFIKIEDGCERRCAYCAVPNARGFVRSRSIASLERQALAARAAGYREVVLSGVNLSCYGRGLGTDLSDAAKCVKNAGIERLRLGSLEPDMLSDRLLSGLAEAGICPHFHLSLQSGCADTLRRMGRLYSPEEYMLTVQRIKELFPGASFTTDVIVGFPAESDAEFSQSLEFVKTFGFLKVHVFRYSPREGTPAALMDGQIAPQVKELRSAAMSEACEAVRAEIIASMANSEAEVLLERKNPDGLFTGYCERYVPYLIAGEHRRGDIVKITNSRYALGVLRVD